MRTLRSQLILSHILPFLLVLPLITIALLYLVETQVLLANLSQRATERATLIGEAIQRQVEVLGSPAEAQAFVADLTVSLDGRVLLLTPDGRLLASGGRAVTAPRSRCSRPASPRRSRASRACWSPTA